MTGRVDESRDKRTVPPHVAGIKALEADLTPSFAATVLGTTDAVRNPYGRDYSILQP